MSSNALSTNVIDLARPVSARDVIIFAVVGWGITILTRVWVFPLSVIDWDESDYLIISRDILHGMLPYQGAFDHKPVALYYLFALAQLIFEQKVYAIRILAVAFVGGTAFLISLFLRKLTSAGTLASAVTGAAYALTSIINEGLSTNTEILINLYFVAALILINTGHITVRFSPGRAIGIGVVLGLMFHTNYLSGLLILGLCVIYLLAVCLNRSTSHCVRIFLANGLIIFAGFVGITMILLTPIMLWSNLGTYFGKQVAFLSAYRGHLSLSTILFLMMGSLQGYFHLLALAAALLAFLVWSTINSNSSFIADHVIALQMLVYLCFALLAYFVSGRFYAHYLILSLPALSIIAGLSLAWVPTTGGLQRFFAMWLILISLALVTTKTGTIMRGFEGYRALMSGRAPDIPTKIAEELHAKLRPNETIYVYDYQPILYYLTGVHIPTHYPFSELHLSLSDAESLGIRPADEVARIMSQSPRFVVTGSEPANGKYGAASLLLSNELNQDYRLVNTYDWPETRGHVWVYERRTQSGSAGLGHAPMHAAPSGNPSFSDERH